MSTADVTSDPGSVKVVISVREERQELYVPIELLNDKARLFSNLREQGASLPEAAMISKNSEGNILIHEQPSFG